MADKMMRIAGRSENGLAKALKVDNEGRAEVKLSEFKETQLRESVSVTPNQFERINIETKYPYKIFVRQKDNVGERWRVRKADVIGGSVVLARAYKTIIESDGENVVVGDGARAEAHSDLLLPLGGRTEFYLYNYADTNTIFDVFIVEYPFGVNEFKTAIENSDESEKTRTEVALQQSATGSVSASAYLDVYENETETRLDYLEFSSNSRAMQLFLEYRDENGSYNPIGQILADGSNVAGFVPRLIVEQGASLFNIVAFEEGKNKFALNRSLSF